jgi:hypothetical protein
MNIACRNKRNDSKLININEIERKSNTNLYEEIYKMHKSITRHYKELVRDALTNSK